MDVFPPTQRTEISLFLCLVTLPSLSECLSLGNGQELKSYHLTWQKDKVALNRAARERIWNTQPSFQQPQWGRHRGRNALHRTPSWHSDPRAIWRIKQQANEDQLPAGRTHRDLLEKNTSRRDPRHWQLIPSPSSSSNLTKLISSRDQCFATVCLVLSCCQTALIDYIVEY